MMCNLRLFIMEMRCYILQNEQFQELNITFNQEIH